MSNDLHDDPAFDALAAARPDAPVAKDSPDSPAARALFAAIVAPTAVEKPAARSRSRSRRVRIGASVLSTAAAITVAVVAVNTVGVHNGQVVVRQEPAAADVVKIARASTSAFGSTGRAVETFDVGSGLTAQRGTSHVRFSGRNLDVAMHFDDENGRPGFDAHNLTVDGQYYLYDGPIGAKKWYHDTTATPTGSDIFDLDPRNLIAVLRPSAKFVVVDTQTTAGGPVRHIRATDLSAMPSLHLASGPVDGKDVTSLDLWVAGDDTVQRLTLTSSHTEIPQPACFTQDGVKQCAQPGDQLVKTKDHITIIPGPRNAAPPKPVTTKGSYSVTFSDIGSPITIAAPAGAIEVAGKG